MKRLKSDIGKTGIQLKLLLSVLLDNALLHKVNITVKIRLQKVLNLKRKWWIIKRKEHEKTTVVSFR